MVEENYFLLYIFERLLPKPCAPEGVTLALVLRSVDPAPVVDLRHRLSARLFLVLLEHGRDDLRAGRFVHRVPREGRVRVESGSRGPRGGSAVSAVVAAVVLVGKVSLGVVGRGASEWWRSRRRMVFMSCWGRVPKEDGTPQLLKYW